MKMMMSMILLTMVLAGMAQADEEITDAQIGLSRTSVFDTPEPEPFDYDGSAPTITALTRADAPVIAHETRDFERITLGRNRCIGCHLRPELAGSVVPEGEPTPIPADHYARLPTDGSVAQVAGARWVCTQCHVSQANAKSLVVNTSAE